MVCNQLPCVDELASSRGRTTHLRLYKLIGSISTTDPREHRIGAANRENVHHLLSNLAIHPFTERLGMSIDEVNALVDRARSEAANPALKPYFPLWVPSPYYASWPCH